MNKRILFIHPGLWSFIACDESILKSKYQLDSFFYKPSKSLFYNVLMQAKLAFWLLIKIWRSDVLFLWFADYHTFLPTFIGRVFKKKVILLLAGYDVTYIPSLKYGAFSNPLRSFCAGYSIKNAHVVLPVDDSLAKMALEKTGKIRGHMITIPFGLDPQEWFCDTPKENFVLTVANIKDRQTFLRKGLDFYIETARQLPEYEFVIIGLTDAVKLDNLPMNITLKSKMDRNLLRDYYARARVYAQFSVHEGLPNVLLEAMLCECIPIGTNVCGIPTGIGDSGYVITTIEDATLAIKKSMIDGISGINARNRIIDHFHILQREKAIYEVIEAE